MLNTEHHGHSRSVCPWEPPHGKKEATYSYSRHYKYAAKNDTRASASDSQPKSLDALVFDNTSLSSDFRAARSGIFICLREKQAEIQPFAVSPRIPFLSANAIRGAPTLTAPHGMECLTSFIFLSLHSYVPL